MGCVRAGPNVDHLNIEENLKRMLYSRQMHSEIKSGKNVQLNEVTLFASKTKMMDI